MIPSHLNSSGMQAPLFAQRNIPASHWSPPSSGFPRTVTNRDERKSLKLKACYTAFTSLIHLISYCNAASTPCSCASVSSHSMLTRLCKSLGAPTDSQCRKIQLHKGKLGPGSCLRCTWSKSVDLRNPPRRYRPFSHQHRAFFRLWPVDFWDRHKFVDRRFDSQKREW